MSPESEILARSSRDGRQLPAQPQSQHQVPKEEKKEEVFDLNKQWAEEIDHSEIVEEEEKKS